MLRRKRHPYTLHQVISDSFLSCTVCQEKQVFQDSTATHERSKTAKVKKAHAHIFPLVFSQVFNTQKKVYSLRHKTTIANEPLSLTKGMFTFTSDVNKIHDLARPLPPPPQFKATVSIPVIVEYVDHPSIDSIAIGENVSENARIMTDRHLMTFTQTKKAESWW